MSRPSRNMRAFTLVETIVTIALTTLVTIALAVMIQYFYKSNAYTLQQSEAVQSARSGVNGSMAALREASYGADGSYPVTAAATSSITFYADINNDGNIEKVNDYLSGSNLYQAVTEPTSTPPTYVGQPVATSTLATFVTNGTSTPVFTYYDDDGSQLSLPIDIADISSVQTTVIVDVNVNRAPVAFTLSAGATLRNLSNQ